MYFIILFLGIGLSLINDRKKISFNIFLAVIAILAFLRFGVGADYFSYQTIYNCLSDSVLSEIKYGSGNLEIGFRLLGSFFKKFGFSYQQFIIVIATVNLFFIARICQRYSKNPTLSLLLYYSFYYLVWTFGGLRQGIVLSIGIYYLLRCLEKKELFKLIVIVLLLSSIHASAFVLLLLYLVAELGIGKSEMLGLTLLSFAISVIPLGLVIGKMPWLPFYGYIEPYLGTEILISNIINFQSFGRLVFLVIIFIYYDSFSKDATSKKFLNMYLMGFVIYFTFKFSELTAARLAIYGKLLDILILPNIYYLYKEKINKAIFVVCLMFLCVFYLSKELSTMKRQTGFIASESFEMIMPYTSVFNDDLYDFTKRVR